MLRVIPGTKAVALILYDGAALVLGIVLASALCQWLRLLTAAAAAAASTTSSSTTPPQRGAADFHNPFYLLAHACVPPILGLLYVRDPLGTTCLDGAGAALWLDGMELPTADESRSAAAAATTGWPLALVFHVIVTMSLWFMNRQARQLRNSEKALQELRDELTQTTKAKKKK